MHFLTMVWLRLRVLVFEADLFATQALPCPKPLVISRASLYPVEFRSAL